MVVWLIAKAGGWQDLAEAYAIEQYPARNRQRGGLQTIYINRTRYKGSVTVDYDEYGVYLYPLILFRIGHSLLYIPWDEVTVQPKSVTPSIGRGLFNFDFTRVLTFQQKPDVRVVFSKRLVEKMERFRGVPMI